MKLRLDEVERIAQRLSFLKPFDSDYAGHYIRLKAIRADLVDGILPPSWPRDHGFIPRHSLASSTLTPSYAPNASPTFVYPVATQATRPSRLTPICRKCYFCGHDSHKIRNCRVAARYLKQGKCIRVESTSLIMHIDGTPIVISRRYTLKDRIDARFPLRSIRSRTHQPLRRQASHHAVASSSSASIPSRVAFTMVTRVKSAPNRDDSCESSISKEPTRLGRLFTTVAAQEPVKQVEGTLFRVLKHGFAKWSESVFRDMFSLPQGTAETREGETDDNPIKLVGCTKAEFESLLELMYPTKTLGLPSLPKQEWISVLKLSRLWDMPAISAIAIQKLECLTLTPVDKVRLGKAYSVPTWLKHGYTSLLQNSSSASQQDLVSLGWETAFRVVWAREEIAKALAKPDVRDGLRLSCWPCYKKGKVEFLGRSTGRSSHCSACGLTPGDGPGKSGGVYVLPSSPIDPSPARLLSTRRHQASRRDCGEGVAVLWVECYEQAYTISLAVVSRVLRALVSWSRACRADASCPIISHRSVNTYHFQPCSHPIIIAMPFASVTSPSLTSTVPRGRYYFETVALKIEGVIHRVPKQGLVECSSVFRDMFSLPQAHGAKEGDTDENPIELTGCTSEEFESVIQVMYPLLGEIAQLSKDKWVGVLKVARLWDMPRISKIAISTLDIFHLTAIEKVKLGNEHGVVQWLKEGYSSLIQDLSQTSLSEISSLGSDTAIRILWARDELARSPILASRADGYWIGAQDLLCTYCRTQYSRNTVWIKGTSACQSCGVGYNAHCWNLQVGMSGSSLESNFLQASSAAIADGATEKALEVFKEELEDAERRDTSSVT
ncbi:hypothetical protein NMY22_g18274 [Coprinellus aureogranulatus]|nr:hypothetical protein NMY22_g18274 [Coprinellus aureogranulatus]